MMNMSRKMGYEMTLEDVSMHYGIDVETLLYYEKMGLFDDVSMKDGQKNWKAKDIEKLEVIVFLKSVDMPMNDIIQYLEYVEQGDHQAMGLLQKHRCVLMKKLHHDQKCVDQLDCYIYQWKKSHQ